MKSILRNLSLLPALFAAFNLLPAGRVTAQTFTTLYSFTAASHGTNSDGASPSTGLILSGNTLYGTAYNGGGSARGTVFAVNINGTVFRTLHSFTTTSCDRCPNSDGAWPSAGLILSGNTLYGTACGVFSNYGTAFKVNTDGTGFTNLHDFNGSDGALPRAGLILSGNTLYGTASEGGSSGYGTVFAINTDGTGFTNLHSFSPLGAIPYITNYDGASPWAGLILSGNTLYGTAIQGGSSGNGTVFGVNTDGTGFTNLHSFSHIPGYQGDSPQALILSGNTLYGTVSQNVSSGSGTVFAVNTDGTGFTILHGFTASSTNSSGVYTNSDGASPGALILSGNTLYGAAAGGSSSGAGTMFAVNTDGTDFTTLYGFTGGGDGANPAGGLILSGNTLYGTAQSGGNSGLGMVFSLSFTPQLTITRSAANAILSWPTNLAGFDYTGYTLQSTTNVLSPPVWTINLPLPVVVSGQNTVTNPITGAQKFYRLIR